MNVAGFLEQPILDVAKAIGLASAAGDLDPSWFGNPIQRLESVLTNSEQLAAVLDLLDQIAPSSPIPGIPDGEKWHALLGPQPQGNLYLTVDSTDTGVAVGVGGQFLGTDNGATAALRIQLPLVRLSGSTCTTIAGTSDGPLTVTLTVPLGWMQPAHPIALAGVAIQLRLAPLATPPIASVAVTLQGLALDASPAHDTTLDPASIGSEATTLLLGLVRERLDAIKSTASGSALAIATHLAPLLGIDGSLPRFPFETLATDATAIATWLRSLLAGSPPPIQAWLGHLAGLFGVAAPTVTTISAPSGTSWAVPLLAFDSRSSLSLAFAQAKAADGVTPTLGVQLGLSITPPLPAAVRVDALATIFTLPLAGTSAPSGFTQGSLVVVAPSDASQPLVASGSAVPFSLDSLRAGVAWNGARIAPLLEMRNVVISGEGMYPVVDLTNANTVVAAASAGLADAIKAALGNSGPGYHLAVLAGLVEPTTDAAAPLADPIQLATHPTQTIGALHRAALLSTSHSWKNYFGELSALLSLSGSIKGSGTSTDPWASEIGSAGALTLQLVAWNDQSSTAATDPQQLRVGVRLLASNPTVDATCTMVLFSADLPATGSAAVALLAGCRANVEIVPKTGTAGSGIAVSATSISASCNIPFGSTPTLNAKIVGLSIALPSGTVTLPTLTYPPPAGFDVQNPMPTLGISASDLERIVTALLADALDEALGTTGLGLAVLLGCGAGVAGMPADLPTLVDPAAPTQVFTDPLSALRGWLARIATGTGTDGTAYAEPILGWLYALTTGTIPSRLVAPPNFGSFTGSGTYDDPWQLPLGAPDSPASGLLWLEPAGPARETTDAATNIGASESFSTLAGAIADDVPDFGAWPAGLGTDGVASGWNSLSDHLTSTDGVVPVTSQIPTGGTWKTGTPIGAAHHLQPQDPSACTQILAAVDGWAAPGSARAILLLGPRFSDHTTWNALLAQAESAHANTTNSAATFNLRISDVAPASIDLRPVTAVADYYSADLQDDGTGNTDALVAQIGLVLSRVQALRAGAAIVLVAHSTAGVAARAYAAANPTEIKGLVTLGTPHGGAPLTPLTDAITADGLRAYTRLLPKGVAAGPLSDALQHLLAALDGYLPAASGKLATPWPYPVGAFAGSASSDTGGVPALALGGQLGGTAGVDLLGALCATAAATVTANDPATPTHLSFGLQAAIPLGPDGDVAVESVVRLDAGRLTLSSGAAEPTRPAHAIIVLNAVSRPGGWLVGTPGSHSGAGSAPVDVRLRSAEFGLQLTVANGALAATPLVRLHEAAFHGTTVSLASWGDPIVDALLGSALQSITSPAPTASTSLGVWLSAIQAFGIAAPDPHGGIGFSADALKALSTDAIGFLTPKVTAAFGGALVPGFTSSPDGTFVMSLGGLPLELFVRTAPGEVGVRTSAGAKVSLATGVSLQASVALSVPALTPDISASLSAGPATVTYANSVLSLSVPPALPPLQLYPPVAAATMTAAFDTTVPALLFSAAASALIDSILDPGYRVGGLLPFISDPGSWIVQTIALGDGTVFDPAKLNALFGIVGPLPGGVTLSASGSNPTKISLATTTPLGGVLSLAGSIAIDRNRHLTPSGTLTLQTNLTGTWPSVTVAFGITPGGLSLVVTPGAAAGKPIQLLPTFDGAASLAAAAEALLLQALDGLLSAVAPSTTPPLVRLALDVATAIDLYDAAGGFAAHASQLAALTAGDWFASLASAEQSAFVTAVSKLFTDATSPLHGTFPGTVTSVGSTIEWTTALSGSGTGMLALTLGWAGGKPTIVFGATNVVVAGGPISATVSCGYAGGSIAADASISLDLQSSLGVNAAQITMGITGGVLTAVLLPLGAGTAATLSVQLLPSVHAVLGTDAAEQLIEDWAIPLVADLLISATGTHFASPLWPGGPTLEHVLQSAKIITVGSGPAPDKYSLAVPLPDANAMLSGVMQALAPVTVSLASNPALALSFVADGGKLGLRVLGSVPLNAGGSPEVSVLFGQPALWLGPTAGVTLYLFSSSGGLTFAPELNVRGLGLGLSGGGDQPLIRSSGFRVGAVDAYLAFDLPFTSGSISNVGGGLEIDQLGLPINQLDAGAASNPVAASLLSAGGTSGDSAPVNPAVDVIVYYLDGAFAIEFAGTNQPIVIPVHASLGPLYIDQIDLSVDGSNAVEMGVDGDVKISGLDIGVDDLALRIPLASILSPSDWSLDLQGLAVGFNAGPVEIAGGLRKDSGPPIQYDGMLSVTVADIGFSIVAAYSRPSDAQGGYTSLFMFVSLPIPLGGPPFAFITGLGGGFGYNRELQIPDDLSNIDSFLLVRAIDDDGLANDPMGALMQMGQSIPPRRGSFWIAAGLRFTSFGLVNSTVIVAVALDRGFEIDILGISRMALPTESLALASVELALKARFNSEEGLLSVQAQLTDNSYIFSHDCQLTGGFAFYIWFTSGQFVLTLGGYNPAFSKPAEFPDVPRLGFNWSVGSLIVIKGGAYFALTNSCVMAGGSLIATASIGPVSAWFTAYVDFLVCWDPFAYQFGIGIEIGLTVETTVCFIECASISLTLSRGAQLAIAGPPFHGTVTVDAYVTTITIAFGDDPQAMIYTTDWNVFAGKYLTAGDSNNTAVSVQFSKGLLPPNPPGAQPLPGTAAQPWPVGIEFTLRTTTRMPANATTDFVNGASAGPLPNVNTLDIAPMDETTVTSTHNLTLEALNDHGQWVTASLSDASNHWTIAPTIGSFPEATWHFVDPQNIPAGARTISAVAGFSVDGHVAFNDISALIPISTLVDDEISAALPLPLATTATVAGTLQVYGGKAEQLAATLAKVSSAQMLAASRLVLSGNSVFSQNRIAVGLPASGLVPIAAEALTTGRSAPPVVAPLTMGLTMKPVGLPAPVTAEEIPPTTSVRLTQPRLRAALVAAPTPVTDAPAALHTSVDTLAIASDVPRMSPPVQSDVTGARLLRIPAADAPRPTRAAVSSRSIRNADLGAAIGPAHQQAMLDAATGVMAAGVALAAGASHLWDLPSSRGAFSVSGNGTLRVVHTDRSGAVLLDSEMNVGSSAVPAPPSGTALTMLSCLGVLPSGAQAVASGPGAVALLYAPSGAAAVVGWQTGSTLLQIGPTRFACRGASLRVVQGATSRRNGQLASYGVTDASSVTRDQPAIETRLPASVDVIIIALDAADPTAAQEGDLAIGVDGGTLASPVRVVTGTRRMLCYDIATRDQGASAITISIASVTAWSIAGVIGARGRASEWSTRLATGLPDHFVPDGPIAPGGSITVTYTAGETP